MTINKSKLAKSVIYSVACVIYSVAWVIITVLLYPMIEEIFTLCLGSTSESIAVWFFSGVLSAGVLITLTAIYCAMGFLWEWLND